MLKNRNELGVNLKYLLINETDKKYGLWVNTVGSQFIQRNWSLYPAVGHPDGYAFDPKKGRVLHEYQLVYITKGRGLFMDKSKSVTQICKGRLILLLPKQWHTYHPCQETGWDEYYIGFEGPIMDNIIKESFFFQKSQVLEIGFNEELISLYCRALEVAEADKVSSQQYLAGIVLHMLGIILSVSKNKLFEVGEVEQKMERAKSIMVENVFKEINLEDLASELNFSYSWFRKVFKDYTGYAPAKYFQELKLRRAKQLLIETSLSVKEIIFMLGYNNAEHFFALFKNNTGYTPTQYRSVMINGVEL